ncbi:hypothetical protein RJT34_12994 [Clitoria ternatea]|uniref:Uncharacterized protein n=1 Tax=Clitoria ternatea TaxID=43366 RepID=A0AAN9JPV2_CLITE
MPQGSKRPRQPNPTSFAPPPPIGAGTSSDISMVIQELQVMKKMQLRTNDLVLNHDLMLRKIATTLNVDHTEEMGVPPDRDLWLASIGFTIPPDDTPLAAEFPPYPEQDNDESMNEENKEEDD